MTRLLYALSRLFGDFQALEGWDGAMSTAPRIEAHRGD